MTTPQSHINGTLLLKSASPHTLQHLQRPCVAEVGSRALGDQERDSGGTVGLVTLLSFLPRESISRPDLRRVSDFKTTRSCHHKTAISNMSCLHRWDFLGVVFKKARSGQMVVTHTFNPSTWEAKAGGSLSLRPAWSAESVPGQPGTLS